MQVKAHRLEALAVAHGEILLLAIDHQQAEADHRGIHNAALPCGEHIDVSRGEPPLAGLHGAIARHRRRQNPIKRSRCQGEPAFELGKHRGQIGPLRQSVGPSPFQRFDHRCGDPGVLREGTQAEALRFTTGPEQLAKLQQLALSGALLRRGARPPGTVAKPPKARKRQSHGPCCRERGWPPLSNGSHSPLRSRRQHPS